MCRIGLLLLVLLPSISGCAAAPCTVQTWASRNGGTLRDARLEERARTLAASILHGRTDVRVNVAILKRDDLAAFSWPGGAIFLSRGLLEALDDELLCAAIAHEVAHIAKHRAGQRVAALRSASAPLEAEANADRAGVALLVACGLPADAMERMLLRVSADDGLAPRVREDLRRRVELLRAR